MLEWLVDNQENYDIKWIRGNHDVWVYQYVAKHIENESWLYAGGRETKDQLDALFADEPHYRYEFIKCFDCSHLYYVDDNNRLFVHGGITHKEAGLEFSEDIYYWDRSMWKKALHFKAIDDRKLNEAVLPAFMQSYSKIFIGHNPTLSVGSSAPVFAGNVVNLDTGAGYFGPLTIMNVDTLQWYQSDLIPSLYD
jgi:serine/threonine protein phosphatase 1